MAFVTAVPIPEKNTKQSLLTSRHRSGNAIAYRRRAVCPDFDCLSRAIPRRVTPNARMRRGRRADVEIPEALHLADPMRTIDGTDYDFSKTKGRVVLVVNVASKEVVAESNFTLLNDLYSRYHQAGLDIIAFPSNWFGQKEPGSDEEVAERIKPFGVDFVVMSKLANFDVEANPVFELGIKHFPGEIMWNFHGKFLFDRDGIPVARFDILTTGEYIESRIQTLI